uniref:Ig-like domain-containing protein n=1 Tax=Dromaius novaehollandiae TaxID=8790 RepID=A0A8C4JZY3_DRONO
MDRCIHRQAVLKCLSAFTGHAQKDFVLQFPPEATIQAGHSITLHCNFSSSYSNPYIFWYQQLPAQPPKLLLQVGKWKPQAESGRFSSSLSVENSLKILCSIPSRCPTAFHVSPPALGNHQCLAGGSPHVPESVWVSPPKSNHLAPLFLGSSLLLCVQCSCGAKSVWWSKELALESSCGGR